MSKNYVVRHKLSVDVQLANFLENDLLPHLSYNHDHFWQKLESIISIFTPENQRLLEQREQLQQKINTWFKQNNSDDFKLHEHEKFLRKIGYLEPAIKSFKIRTKDIDPEITSIAGPQLVVPVSNARFALNACNSRWGSLFDALYGSNAILDTKKIKKNSNYDRYRGQIVIDYALNFLDKAIPLEHANYADIDSFLIDKSQHEYDLKVILKDGAKTQLRNNDQFIGWTDNQDTRSLLFKNNDLHIDVQINPNHHVGAKAPGNIFDIHLESAVTTIMDCEDSVAAVDAEDKVNVYRNWLGLSLGNLTCKLDKAGKKFERSLNKDRVYNAKNRKILCLSGRSLMLVRNVGQHMTTDMVLDSQKKSIFEGLIDAVITTLCALAGNQKTNGFINSKTNSIYIVKPKLHGSSEVKLFNLILDKIEELFELSSNTIKVGLMDEERRTSCNLMQCISEIRHRIVFINTGFLDRTGDEIHTNMHLGPMLEKEKIKQEPWLDAYEKQNVEIGIACGFRDKAQIGKGMWAKPDELKEMMQVKIEHPRSGANCAWVPSPSAATLHAIHYHYIYVKEYQIELENDHSNYIKDILKPPVDFSNNIKSIDVQNELRANIQSILGYIVHWVNDGIGCSKVLDINNIYLMEDRATLRISVQHIQNWLMHKICSKEQVMSAFYKMAKYVDKQNVISESYRGLIVNNEESYAFQAACELVFEGYLNNSGYTENTLHKYRKLEKQLYNL